MKQDSRELDARVSEKVMGWTAFSQKELAVQGPQAWQDAARIFPRVEVCASPDQVILWADAGRNGEDWEPSTSIADAFQVVEKMRERGLSFVLEADTETTQWFAAFGDVPGCGSIADTAPLAIVGAALAAIEATEKESTPSLRSLKAACYDCGAPYGADGWVDVVIPHDIWNSLADFTAGGAGLLCFRCMTKRIEAKGLNRVPVIVASGPYADENERWRLIGLEQGRQQVMNDPSLRTPEDK